MKKPTTFSIKIKLKKEKIATSKELPNFNIHKKMNETYSISDECFVTYGLLVSKNPTISNPKPYSQCPHFTNLEEYEGETSSSPHKETTVQVAQNER